MRFLDRDSWMVVPRKGKEETLSVSRPLMERQVVSGILPDIKEQLFSLRDKRF